MVKKQAETPIEEEKVKHGSFKKALVKLLVLFILAAAAYGIWKNPALIDEAKSLFSRQPKEDVYQQQIDALTMQMQSLQQQLAATRAQIKEPDLSAFDERIKGIEKMNLNVIDSKADVATVLGVVTRMDKAEQKLDKLTAVTDDSALVLTGVLLVKDSAERGGNFEYEVEVLSNIAAENPQMAKEVQNLVPFAKEGISSELDLVKEFDEIYTNLWEQQKTDFDKTWKERLNTKLSEIVQIKKTNENAPEFSADKKLENIKQYVDDGELFKAASLLMLPENQEWMQNEVLQQWVKKVQAREEFYDLIEDLSASSLAALKVNFLKKKGN